MDAELCGCALWTADLVTLSQIPHTPDGVAERLSEAYDPV
jgi:hypothetical protein